MKFISILLSLSLSLSAFAFELTTEEKLADLNQMVSNLKQGYGPLEHKKSLLNIDIDKLHEDYTKKVMESKTNSEFYYLMMDFIAEFKDGHFWGRIPSTHIGKMGFLTSLIDGKVLIDMVDRNSLSESVFPYNRGDEVVAINGKDVQLYLDQLQTKIGLGSDLSARSRATYALTSRRGASMPVLSGKVIYSIKKHGQDKVNDVELEWKLSGEALDEFDKSNKLDLEQFQIPSYLQINSKYNNITELSMRNMLEDTYGEDLDATYHCNGGTRIAIPEDATVIMLEPFVAYYHPTEKGNIGYLRIPHYSPENQEYELRFEQYKYAVSELQKNTVGLIIDQDHNCGGSVDYLHKILTLFINKPFPSVGFKFLSTKSEMLDFKAGLEQWYKPHTIDYFQFKEVAKMVEESWLAGNRMTEMSSFYGDKLWLPNSEVNYTKPIIVLIDHQSGSGGDAFPVMMKGLGRAKLLGTPTMGLGGHVEGQPALSNSVITYSITKSLFHHPDGTPVENYGAQPDIPYVITAEDFVSAFHDYQKFYVSELLKMLP